MALPSLKQIEKSEFIEDGKNKVLLLLSAENELVAYDIMKKDVLSIKPKDERLGEIYQNWMSFIATESKHRSVRLLAIEEMYRDNNVEGLKTAIRETRYPEDRKVAINLIIESCKEYQTASPLDSLAHRIGLTGTANIRVEGKDWAHELPSIVNLIKDYELKKDTAERVYAIIKEKKITAKSASI